MKVDDLIINKDYPHAKAWREITGFLEENGVNLIQDGKSVMDVVKEVLKKGLSHSTPLKEPQGEEQ